MCLLSGKLAFHYRQEIINLLISAQTFTPVKLPEYDKLMDDEDDNTAITFSEEATNTLLGSDNEMETEKAPTVTHTAAPDQAQVETASRLSPAHTRR